MVSDTLIWTSIGSDLSALWGLSDILVKKHYLAHIGD